MQRIDELAKNVVELRGINKTINDLEILENINLEVQEGEFLTLLGPSGCGKTTLLRLISGFEEPTKGSIFIDGKDVSGLPPTLRHVHTVFQSYALFPHMTVFDNVAFGLRCQKVAAAEIETRVADVIKMVKLEKYLQRKPGSLSGGQQQRVAIARAAVNRPRVLLLDEPLSSLDYRLRKTMQLELKHLQRLRITFIFVTRSRRSPLHVRPHRRHARRAASSKSARRPSVRRTAKISTSPNSSSRSIFSIGKYKRWVTTIKSWWMCWVKRAAKSTPLTLAKPCMYSSVPKTSAFGDNQK